MNYTEELGLHSGAVRHRERIFRPESKGPDGDFRWPQKASAMYGMDPGKWSGLTETTEEAVVINCPPGEKPWQPGPTLGNEDGEKWVVSPTPSGPPPSPPLALVISVTQFNT